MRVFKFGGASVKDYNSLINLKNIIECCDERLVVITSAMGKTTNRLEEVWQLYIKNQKKKALDKLSFVVGYHQNIYQQLCLHENEEFVNKFQDLTQSLKSYINIARNKNVGISYDAIVSYGELWSTTILSYYLVQCSIKNKWLDARRLIKTSDHFQEARVNLKKSKKEIQESIDKTNNIYISQGFIGANEDGITTTLGREGSDYSAAIFGWALNASEVVIWKDVTGLLNADPKLFEKTVQLKKISYKEAIELSYLGASVIHPKTIKPLQNKEIPLTIRSFIETNNGGSTIHFNGENDKDVPSYIFKPDQILLSITTKDYSFIFEDHISELFKLFAENNLKVHLMQNSALSFSVCGYIKSPLLKNLIENLSEKYLVKYNEKVDLLTVRHYKEFDLPKLVANQEILIQQRSRTTIRYVLRK